LRWQFGRKSPAQLTKAASREAGKETMKPITLTETEIRQLQRAGVVQVRRTIKPQPEGDHADAPLTGRWLGRPLGGLLMPRIKDLVLDSPFGAPGNLRWVKEAWGLGGDILINPCLNYRTDGGQACVHKRLSKIEGTEYCAIHWEAPAGVTDSPTLLEIGTGWQSASSMPRWASRYTVRLESVKVERVQDISEEDAMLCGIVVQSPPDITGNRFHWGDATQDRCPTAKDAYRALHDSTAKRGQKWEANPWQWCGTFRRETK